MTTLHLQDSEIRSVAYSPDGSNVAAGLKFGVFIVFEAELV